MIKIFNKLKQPPYNHEYFYFNDIEPRQRHFLDSDELKFEFVKNVTEKSKNQNLKTLLYLRHLHFINFENYNQKNPIYINIIRNPVERWISSYYYLRNGFEKDQKQTPEQRKKWETKWRTDPNRHLSIEECIEKGLSDCVKGPHQKAE